MRISIVVATRNRADLIGDCLDALSALRGDDLEILVVDQSTEHGTAVLTRRAARQDPRIRHIASATIGASAARNIGIQRSSGDVVAFTDDDCVPADDWALEIASVFVENPDAAAVFGRCLPWDEVRPGERAVALKLDTRPRRFAGKVNPWKPGHGNNMAIRRVALEVIGGFDERLGPGTRFYSSEDADLTYRMLSTGMDVVYSPRPTICHKQFRHGEELWKLERGYGIGAGAFYAKHLRNGDMFIPLLVLDRWWTVGMRHIIYGMLTLRGRHIRLGWQRIATSVEGMWAARSAEPFGERGVFGEYAREAVSARK